MTGTLDSPLDGGPASALTPTAGLHIRPATKGDGAVVRALVRELAEFEKLLDHVTATAADFEDLLCAPSPRVFCDLAEWEGVPVGLAFWFYNASTFRGRLGIYLEDIYVQPGARGHGIGKALMVNLARRAVDQGLPRIDWVVLGWNTRGQEFFQTLGAVPLTAWNCFRLTGGPLADLAGCAPSVTR